MGSVGGWGKGRGEILQPWHRTEAVHVQPPLLIMLEGAVRLTLDMVEVPG